MYQRGLMRQVVSRRRNGARSALSPQQWSSRRAISYIPALLALLLLHCCGDSADRAPFRRRLTTWRISPRWYILGLTLVPLTPQQESRSPRSGAESSPSTSSGSPSYRSS